jgi:hypothetical protein
MQLIKSISARLKEFIVKNTEVVIKKIYKKHYVGNGRRKMTPERLEVRNKIAAAILAYEMQLEQESNG